MKPNAAPSVIIITRHGARLDAEDAGWQSRSPAPYDTPLSYGGWTQTRALGARIASLLHAREMALNADDRPTSRRGTDHDIPEDRSAQTSPTRKKRKRKHHVVIQSSPFLRCIQSSIAISAGMAQYQGNLAKFEFSETSTTPPASKLHSTAPTRSLTLDASVIESRLKAVRAQESLRRPAARVANDIASQRKPLEKPVLRIDGCLGEWLSPDYFESIIPPPPSKMMVAGAKAELMRSATPILGHGAGPTSKSTPQTPLHKSPYDAAAQSMSMADLARMIPSLPSAGASDEEADDYFSNIITNNLQDGLRNGQYGYAPPQPNYSLRASEPIPSGYVAHAREACVKIDFQWDSMREPQNWGDGGEHGEEWSSMHRRFRSFLGNMVSWYKLHASDFDPQNSSLARSVSSSSNLTSESDGSPSPAVSTSKPTSNSSSNPSSNMTSNSTSTTISRSTTDPPRDEDPEYDEDLVVVIVTHGAGCNALIGALTNQPVLLDVGMGSLTMAVRKDTSHLPPARRASSARSRRRSSVDTGLSDEYEMRLIASNEHLRAGTDPLQIPALMSPQLMPSIPEGKRTFSASSGGSLALALGSAGRSNSASSSGTATPLELEQPIRPQSSSLGAMRRRRAATSSTNASTPSSATTPGGSGLWGNYSPATSRSTTVRSGTGRSRADTSTVAPDTIPAEAASTSTVDVADDSVAQGTEEAEKPAPKKATTWSLPANTPQRQGSQRGLWGG